MNVLTPESEYVIEWFGINQMQANPGKFQEIVLGKWLHVKFWLTFQIFV